jgi:P27 family predicted phage terminase small subunit
MARPRKPAATKIIQGTFHKYRNPENEAQYTSLDKMPPAPKEMNRYGKRLWEYGAELVSAGVITKPDIIAFEICCSLYQRAMTLQAFIDGDVLENIKGDHGGRSAQAQQMNADFAACTRMMQEFGLTPSSRNRFGVSKKKEADPDTAKMKELLGV